MSKFKVGDIVKDNSASTYSITNTNMVSAEVSRAYGTSINIINCEFKDGSTDTEGFNGLNEIYFDLVTPQLPKIVIEPKNNGKVSAVLFNGDTYVKHATAKCSPDDTYDFNIGAKLAFNRLMGIEDKPNSADNFDWEKFKNPNSKIAVHCSTEELAKDFLQKCDEHGIKWRTGGNMLFHVDNDVCYSAKFSKYGFIAAGSSDCAYHDCAIVEWTANSSPSPQKSDLSQVTNEELIAELTKRLEQ